MARKSIKKKQQNQNISGRKSEKQESTKKKSKKVSLPMILVGISIMLIVTLGFLFDVENDTLVLSVGQEDATDSTPIPPNTPRMKVRPNIIDYGDVEYNVRKTFTFTVTNTGNTELKFKKYPYLNVVEGC
ncbi:DUF1573 domain-containing protein [bacterium]|nr:DUF1573 domain-containing protein [bacterium]